MEFRRLLFRSVGELADDDERARQNDRGVATHESELHVAKGAPEPHDAATNRVKNSINHAQIENFPKPLTRSNLNRLNDRRVVNLIDVILVLEQSGHGAHRLLLKYKPADCYSG